MWGNLWREKVHLPFCTTMPPFSWRKQKRESVGLGDNGECNITYFIIIIIIIIINNNLIIIDLLTPESSLPFNAGCGIIRPRPWIIQPTTLHKKHMSHHDMSFMRGIHTQTHTDLCQWKSHSLWVFCVLVICAGEGLRRWWINYGGMKDVYGHCSQTPEHSHHNEWTC